MVSAAFFFGIACGLALSLFLDFFWEDIKKLVRREVRTAVALQKEVEA